jgi:hypothetical protein
MPDLGGVCDAGTSIAMSTQKRVVGQDDLERLQEARDAGGPRLSELAAGLAEPLLNTAAAYRELRKTVKQVLDDMRPPKDAEERDQMYRDAVARLEEALSIEFR